VAPTSKQLFVKKDKLMQKGNVAWFSAGKGFGFVTPEDSFEDIYINIKVVRDAGLEALENGQAVGYESGTGQNGRPSVIKLTVF
jgi:cold shock CspA family protein